MNISHKMVRALVQVVVMAMVGAGVYGTALFVDAAVASGSDEPPDTRAEKAPIVINETRDRNLRPKPVVTTTPVVELQPSVEVQVSAPQTPTPAPAPEPVPLNLEGNRALGLEMLLAAGFGYDQWACLEKLWTRESGWNHLAHNPSSGAHGIPQSLPGSKMAAAGPDWYDNPATQIDWGLNLYIKGRYGTPCQAWDFFQGHNWY